MARTEPLGVGCNEDDSCLTEKELGLEVVSREVLAVVADLKESLTDLKENESSERLLISCVSRCTPVAKPSSATS